MGLLRWIQSLLPDDGRPASMTRQELEGWRAVQAMIERQTGRA